MHHLPVRCFCTTSSITGHTLVAPLLYGNYQEGFLLREGERERGREREGVRERGVVTRSALSAEPLDMYRQ